MEVISDDNYDLEEDMEVSEFIARFSTNRVILKLFLIFKTM